MRRFDVYGICNALVDILVDITEEEFQSLEFERGTMRLVDAAEQVAILNRFSSRARAKVSGGSVANSMVAIAQLGGKGAVSCGLGTDENGLFYRTECESLGLTLPSAAIPGAMTGTCVSLITPDAERTMRTALGAASALDSEHISKETMAESIYFFIEGYLFANPEGGQRAAARGIELAKATGAKVVITCSEPWVVNAFREPVEAAVKSADLVFCNEEEALALGNASSIAEAGRKLSKRLPHLIATTGPGGAHIWWEEKYSHVPAFPCDPRDLTGAGDMFAGSFLYGITHGLTPEESARRANFLAKLVISQVGARFSGDLRKAWESV